jgi:hypothetical protein
VGQRGRLERVLKKYVPGPVDVMKEMDHKTLVADGMEGRPQRAYEMCSKTRGGAALCDQCLSGQKTKRCGFAF